MSKRIYLSPPHMSGREQEFIRETFESNWLAPLGPQVDAFEAEFATEVEAGHALAVASGTAALHLALMQAGVRPGDDVMVSTLTFAGSVFPIVYAGAHPVFVDSEPASWNMDPALLAEALEERARANRLPRAVAASRRGASGCAVSFRLTAIRSSRRRAGGCWFRMTAG